MCTLRARDRPLGGTGAYRAKPDLVPLVPLCANPGKILVDMSDVRRGKFFTDINKQKYCMYLFGSTEV